MKVFWTDFAKNELHKIFEYHRDIASLRIAKKLVSGITQAVSRLPGQPRIGQREENLIDREQEFRYILNKNYKVIYWHNIKKDRVEVTDIFDTRQNPEKMQRIT